MKNNIKILMGALILGLMSTSCEEYLDVPPDATLTDEFIFSTYNTYQGFLDPCYDLISDPNNFCLVGSTNMACESISNSGASPAFDALNCNYLRLGQFGRSIWQGTSFGAQFPVKDDREGLYDFWPVGCRIANVAIANLDLLTKDSDRYNAEEAKKRIKGQALFFRAYLNFQVLCAYGSIPYLDQVYDETNIQQPRYYTDASGKKNYQAASEKAARDLREAADLLPLEWEDRDTNLGRITKGAALGLLTKVLLYAGSPLMEEVANNGVVSSEETAYNKEYMERAAKTAAELLSLGAYELTPFGSFADNFKAGDGYRQMFTTIDGSVPYTKEVIFKRWGRGTQNGANLFRNTFMRIYAKGALAGTNPAGGLENPLIEFMDKFEMIDGTQYIPGNTNAGGYDDNKLKFFKQRDPRFDFNYYLHEEKVGTLTCSFENKGTVYSTVMKGPFLMTKYWYPEVDAINQQWGKYLYGTPILRLADILLMYAEAVFEATGNVDGSIGGGPTARQALNQVRKRVNMPDYNPATYAVARTSHGELSTDHPFRLAIRNERAVELAYEGHLWWDLRRWKRMHRMNANVYILDFNKAFTQSSRVLMQPFPFELKHYWLPFPNGDTQVYEGFPQNPGW